MNTILRYAGIGSRQTPVHIQTAMTKLAEHLAHKGWMLRSGFADGADTAFALGADKVPNALIEIFVPWAGFNRSPINDDRVIVPPFTDELLNLAADFHPNWGACSQGAKKLHARNGCQILGLNLNEPVNMVICWTPNGQRGGGTGQALRIAEAAEIPIFDLFFEEDREKCCEMIEALSG